MKLLIELIRRSGCRTCWVSRRTIGRRHFCLLRTGRVGIPPHDWQKTFLLAPQGASIAVLTARQVGKTTAAAVGMAHSAVFMPGSLSVVACPSQNQSAEALRKVRQMVLMAGAKLATDNVFRLELANGSRVLALPGTQELIRGLTVDSWIVADEAAQLNPDIMAALHPMRTQRPNARFAMLSAPSARRRARPDRPRGPGKSATPTQCR